MAEINLTKREIATVLAALRTVQEDPTAEVVFLQMPHFEDDEPLNQVEIDDLCEMINCA